MISTDFPQDLEDLDGELAGRGDDESAEAVELRPLCAVKLLEHRYEESQRLPAARLGGAEDVLVLESQWDAAGLDVGEGGEVRGLDASGGRLGERQIGKAFDLGRFGIL